MDYKCEYCGRILQNKSAMVSHVRGCKLNPNREKLIAELRAKKALRYELHGDYICECGRTFNKKSSLDIHKRYCKLNPKSDHNREVSSKCHKNISEETRQKMRDSHKGNKSHSGIPASESQKAKTSKTLKDRYAKGEIVSWNKGTKGLIHISEEGKRKISEANSNPSEETRRRKRRSRYQYLITHGSQGPRMTSYMSDFEINNITYHLRSRYEFIYALYLAINNIDFEYESVWVKNIYYNSDQTYGRLFLSDFRIRNVIVEIKGRDDPIKHKYAEESFRAKGFEYIYIVGWSEIEPYYEELLNKGIPIKLLFENIKTAYKSNKLLHYKFDINNLDNLGFIKEANCDNESE